MARILFISCLAALALVGQSTTPKKLKPSAPKQALEQAQARGRKLHDEIEERMKKR